MTFDDSMQIAPLEDLLNGLETSSRSRFQSGSFSVNIASVGVAATVTVNFPVAFPSTPNVTCTMRGTNSVDTRHIGVVTRSPTSATFVGVNNDSITNITFDWVAVLP